MIYDIPIYSEDVVSDAEGRLSYKKVVEYMKISHNDDGSVSVLDKPEWVYDKLVYKYIDRFFEDHGDININNNSCKFN